MAARAVTACGAHARALTCVLVRSGRTLAQGAAPAVRGGGGRGGWCGGRGGRRAAAAAARAPLGRYVSTSDATRADVTIPPSMHLH